MKMWYESLLELQASDMRVKLMKERLAEIPKEKDKIQRALETSRKSVVDAELRVKEAKKDVSMIDSEIDEVNEKIKKFQDQSSLIKKNDEYRALLLEIDNHKRKISKLETQQSTSKDAIETAKNQLEQAQKEFGNREKTATESLEELSDLESTMQAEMKKLDEKRAELKSNVDGETLRTYERLLKSKGEPLTAIHNESCGNCYLKLTPQTINDAKKGKVTICDSCAHLVYFSKEV